MPLFDTLTDNYEPNGNSVSSRAQLTVSAGRLATAIGIGRLALGTAFLVAPTVSARILGVDAGAASRMRFLARMTAARDLGLGAGTLAAGPGRAAAPWLVAGGFADAVDAVAIAAALRTGTTRGVPAAAIAVGAAATALVAGWTARRLRA
jgi:hypothetical protein